MAIFVQFELKPIELNCWYDGELEKEHWGVIKKAIADNSLRLGFSHRPTLINLEVPLSAIYEGGADVKVVSDGVIVVSASGKAKIDGSAKAIKEIESDNPSDMAFDSVKAISADGGFGGMSITGDTDSIDAIVKVSAKKL